MRNHLQTRLLLLIGLLCFWPSAGSAETLLDVTLTGLELVDEPGVVFFNAPSFKDDSIHLFSDGENIIFDWTLLELGARETLVVKITIDYTPVTADSDPTVGLHDTFNLVGYARADNDGGSLGKREGIFTSTLPEATGPFGPINLDPIEPFTMIYILNENQGSTLFEYIEGKDRHTDEFVNNPLDSSQFLSLIWGGGTPGEEYLLHSISVQVTEASSNSGLVYFPVPNCRLVNTSRTEEGKFGATENREFVARGETTDYSGQGGVANGCGIPEEAEAIAVNIWGFDHEGFGYLRAGASGKDLGGNFAAVVHFTDSDETRYMNAMILDVCDNSACTSDFQIETRGKAQTHVAIDVKGYFAPFDMVAKTAMDGATGELRRQLDALTVRNEELERNLQRTRQLEKDIQDIKLQLDMRRPE